ncbi:pfs protein [Verticillium dahliae VdLs.17]|uniref:Pfs protein n=1 Tax=Verticillium dahliae (strain VdLs.17 / ATCC MYA-4575 / FGSC 10137) TaxID=498257 RepID=G2XFN4_VERDV|nr:pfs protein [Verticillium dahliae VdLs.17]EGY18632.1 pfs protein [Verticillium dahliae VdLs.17]
MTTINPDNPPKPCDYLDMIGGLITVMRGRLRMSVDDCITAYASLSDEVFEKKSDRVRINGQLQGRFDSKALERAIKQILKRTGHDENALLKDASNICRVFVCATSKETADTVCLTSYRSPRSTHLLDCTTVWKACCVTSAATTLFDAVTIGSFGEQFVDGALGTNNPISALWTQVQDVWGDRLRGCLRATLKELATETEKTAEQFRRDKAELDDDGRYFRFNVVRGLKHIGLEESKRKAEIAAATGRYVASQEALKRMRTCTNGLARRQYLGPYKTPFSLQGVPVSAKFVDRPSDTARLEECLLSRRSHRKGKKVFVLHGLGGVGKTQLAVDFARRHQAAFSSVFWLDGRSDDRLRRSIAGCINRIPEGQIPLASRQQAEGRSVEDLGAAVVSGGVVGVYDVRQYMPWDHGSVLVTTRVSRLAQLAPPGNSCKLAKVDDGLGRAILGELTANVTSYPDADRLLNLLDDLPLALAQAASYLWETGISIAKYLKIYQHQWDVLMASESGHPLLDYEQGSIATTWTVSLRQIEDMNAAAAASLLRLWAFLDNKHMWHGLLTVAAGGGSQQWPGWLKELAGSEVRFLDAIRLLLRYSMIETQEGTGDGYSMHPVVHTWASHLDGRSRGAEQARLGLMMVGLSVPTSDEKEYWVVQQQLLPHAQRCAEWMQSGSPDIFKHIDKSIFRPLNSLGTLYADQGPSTDRTDTLGTVNNRGLLYKNQGKLAEAAGMYRRALAGREKALGPNHTDTLRTVNNLGILYANQGKLAEAEEMFQRALAGYENALGPDHPTTKLVSRNRDQLRHITG